MFKKNNYVLNNKFKKNVHNKIFSSINNKIKKLLYKNNKVKKNIL